MGIAANQARLMTLTARQNDLEYKAQQISATKMQISRTTSQLATNYANALKNYSILNSAQQMGNQYANDYFVVNSDGSYKRATSDTAGAVKGSQLLSEVATKLGTGSYDTANGYLSFQQGVYQTETERLSSQEKIYDMELTQVNTEHDAIKTEYDAIKSLCKDNVEKSFNVFG